MEALRPENFNSREKIGGTHWIGIWVGTTDSLEEKIIFSLPGIEAKTLGRPVRSPVVTPTQISSL